MSSPESDQHSDDSGSNDSGSDDSVPSNSVLYRFPDSEDNNDPVVKALARDDVNEMVDLVFNGKVPVIPRALSLVIHMKDLGRVNILLHGGASPNARLDETAVLVDPGWDQRDIGVEWYDPDPLAGFALTAVSFPLESAYVPNDITRQLEAMRALLRFGADPFAIYKHNMTRDRQFPFPGQHYDDARDPPTSSSARGPNAQFGLRAVAHALIEDGGVVEPLFDEEFAIDFEHRDPQGRTILHSICRSSQGADLPLGATWRDDLKPKDPDVPSIFDAARSRNADVLAVDNDGKSILYHLLDAHQFRYNCLPPIKDALAWTLANCPQLVNQPDRFGTYPLHVALRRLRRRSKVREGYVDDSASVVVQLLDHGANPSTRDARGNTALHYLAESGVTSYDSESVRSLFRRFLDLGLDVNGRNDAGLSVAAVLLSDHPETGTMSGGHGATEEGCKQVLGWVDGAGANWTETDGQGQTLFSALARGMSYSHETYAPFLISKGVNPYTDRKVNRKNVDASETKEKTVEEKITETL